MMTSPWSRYFSYHARRYGNVRRQLMQEYVQKSTSTTLPLSSSGVRGLLFNQATAPSSEGKSPSTGSEACPWLAPAPAIRIIELPDMAIEFAAMEFFAIELDVRAPPRGCTPEMSTSDCSSPEVLCSDSRVSTPVSRPNATAPTAISTAAPRPRRIHSPAPSERLKNATTRPPMSSTTASEVAAPAA